MRVAFEAEKELWEDSRHRYTFSYRLSRTFIQAELQAEYAEYK